MPFGIAPLDPQTYAIVTVLFGAVALVVCYLPAPREVPPCSVCLAVLMNEGPGANGPLTESAVSDPAWARAHPSALTGGHMGL